MEKIIRTLLVFALLVFFVVLAVVLYIVNYKPQSNMPNVDDGIYQSLPIDNARYKLVFDQSVTDWRVTHYSKRNGVGSSSYTEIVSVFWCEIDGGWYTCQPSIVPVNQ